MDFGNPNLNGFVHTIRRMVLSDHDDFVFDKVKFMVAVPERAQRNNLGEYMRFQLRFQQELTSVTNIQPPPPSSIIKGPSVTAITMPTPENPFPILKEIEKLALHLRRKTRRALLNLLKFDVLIPEQNQDHPYTPGQKCFIVGLAVSCNNCDFAQDVRVDEDSNADNVFSTGPICVITDIADNQRKYIIRDNEFREVYRNQSHVIIPSPLGNLYTQLLKSKV
ncbi:uncharacterized protein LOC126835195 isoform X2 [Adelges cooleyi]|nr:uncharacterized protein LOC126835195 isoform X2 [Adelges cooleyi]